MTTLAATAVSRPLLSRLLRGILPLLIVAIVAFFSVAAPGFLSLGNLGSLVLNNFVLLAIVAIGMTWAVAAGVLTCRWAPRWISPAWPLLCCSMAAMGWSSPFPEHWWPGRWWAASMPG